MADAVPMTRRTVLAAAGMVLGGGASAQPAPGGGAAVWLDLDQAALDAAYDQSAYAPNIRQVLARYAASSALVRDALGSPRRERYGPGAVEELDIFRTDRPAAPVLVFVHGGAWRAGRARDYAFPAECFVRAGAHVVIPDFSWVQDQDGDLLPIAEQIRRAVAWTWRHAASFGGDPDRIFIAGHSSGAHMAGVALVTADWAGGFGAPQDVLKGGLLVSGLYDLRPARLSARSRYVRFTDASEAALSAQRHIARLAAPVVVAHGDLETPEFQRQSRDFVAAVAGAGKPVLAIRAEAYNHFEIIETMANPYGPVGRAGLRMMGLAGSG